MSHTPLAGLLGYTRSRGTEAPARRQRSRKPTPTRDHQGPRDPSATENAILAISWRWEWAGALLFACLGTWYLISTWGRMHWSTYVVISGPLFLVGAMFLIDWMYRARLATKSAAKRTRKELFGRARRSWKGSPTFWRQGNVGGPFRLQSVAIGRANDGQSLGGCQPTATQARLARTRVGRLRWRRPGHSGATGWSPASDHASTL